MPLDAAVHQVSAFLKNDMSVIDEQIEILAHGNDPQALVRIHRQQVSVVGNESGVASIVRTAAKSRVFR